VRGNAAQIANRTAVDIRSGDGLERRSVGTLSTASCGLPGASPGVKIDLFLHQQGLDTTTSGGRMMFGMLSVFAEFERAMIRERVTAGMARAKEKGTRSGKAIGRPAIPDHTRIAIRQAYMAGGRGLRGVADQYGVGGETVRRCLS
jgi:DNA invertase Pin-like site-specific DNA recombinase